ncbi:4017_t:CDS:2, partial [Entrophospora sp. SA101]
NAIKFDIQAHPEGLVKRKCITQYVPTDTLVVVTIKVGIGYNQQIDVEVTDNSPAHNEYGRKRDMNEETRIAFTTHVEADVSICFTNTLEDDVGAEAIDYNQLAKAEKLKPMEAELRKLEQIVQEIVDEMEYLRRREARMRDTNGQYLGKTRAHTDQDVQEALRKAQKAQNKWSKTSFAERNKFLNSLLNFIIKNQQEICWVSSRDTGKTLVDAEFGEILTTCERIRWTIENGEKELAPQYHDPSPILPYKIAKIVYQPFALYSGNGILVKASEQVAWSMKYYENIIKTCLIACGHDPDIVQFLCGFAECGEAIVKSGVDGVTFIGSSEVGKKVMKTASYNLTPCILELGGKDCAIIRHDTNLNAAIPIIMRGTFQNSGQNCVGIERVLIHESLHDEFIKKVTKQIELMRIGSALNDNDQFTVDVGALTMSGQAERLKSIVRTSINEGAKLMAGGDIYTHPKYPTSQYFQPTLITDVTKEMSIVQHELFGPIMVVMKFSTDEEAIEICNSSPYGLGNSIFTQNTPIAEEMSYRLRCGMVNINDFGSSYLSNLPFGGVGISGFGKL